MTAIFDFDGTLADTSDIIREAISEIRIEQGLDPLGEEEYSTIKGKIGLSTRDFIQMFVGAADLEKNVDKYMEKSAEKVPQLFPGVEALLHRLRARGIRIIIATNKLQRIIDRVVDNMGCRSLFDEVRGVDYVKFFPKPHISELQCEGKRVFVGDTRSDLVTAKNAGCPFIGVGYGVEAGRDLEDGSFAVVDRPDDLENIIVECLESAIV